MTIIDQPNPIAQALSPIVYRVRVPFDQLVNYIQCDVWIWRGSKTVPPNEPTYSFTKIPNEQQEALIDLSNVVKAKILAPPTSTYSNDVNISTTEGVWIWCAFSWISTDQIGIPTYSETIFATRGWTKYCDGINPLENTHLGQNYPTPFGYLSTQLGYFAEGLECIPEIVQQSLAYNQLGCVNVTAESQDLTSYGVKHGYAFNRINPLATSPFKMIRTLDQAEQDAEFEINGHLDCDKIALFGSGSRVFIKEWYDQFGDTGTNYKNLTGFINQGTGAPNKVQPTPNLILTNLAAYGIGPAYPDGTEYYELTPSTVRYVEIQQTQASPAAENLWISCIVGVFNPREFKVGFTDGIGGTITFDVDNQIATDNRTNAGNLTDPSITLDPLGNGYYQLRAQYHRTAGALASNVRMQLLASGNALYPGSGSGSAVFSIYSVMVSTFQTTYYPPNFLPREGSSLIYDPALGFLRGALAQGLGGMVNKTFDTLAAGSYAVLSLGYGINNAGAGTHIGARRSLDGTIGIGFGLNASNTAVLGSPFLGIPQNPSGAIAPIFDLSDDALVIADYDAGQNLATIFNGESVVTGSTSTLIPYITDNNTIRVNGGDNDVVTRVALIYDRTASKSALWQAVYDSWKDVLEGTNSGELAVSEGFPDSGYLLTEASRKIEVYAGQPYTLSVYPEYIRKLRITADTGDSYLVDLSQYGGGQTTGEKLVHINVGPNWLAKYGLAPNSDYIVEGLNENGLRISYRYCFHIACEYRYKAYAIAFVNRFGVWDWFTFFLRSDWMQSRTYSEFSSNTLWPYAPNRNGRYYETERGQGRIFNVNGERTITLNTNYLSESENERIRDIFMSERVVLVDRDANCRYAVILTNQDFMEKKHRNEKLIQYTMTFKQAFGTINTSAV